MLTKEKAGEFVGKKISIDGRGYKIIFHNPKGMVDLQGQGIHEGTVHDRTQFKFIGTDLVTGQWDYFSVDQVMSAPAYRPTVKLTMEQICKALGRNVEIIK